MLSETRVLEETEEDQVTASMEDGWLTIGVLYRETDNASVWLQDPDAGVILSPESVAALKEFLEISVKS
jgi:hypothetical protein